MLEGPVMITNTHSVGVVRDAVIAWYVKRAEKGKQPWLLPVVAETYDGYLNDINRLPRRKEKHAFAASRFGEGRGGGRGERRRRHRHAAPRFRFAGGIGTASRVLDAKSGGYTVGVLVQSNFGLRHQLRIAGIPVGEELKEETPWLTEQRRNRGRSSSSSPPTPHCCRTSSSCLLRRGVPLGLGRVGSVAGNGSGDIFVNSSRRRTKSRWRADEDVDGDTVQAMLLPNETQPDSPCSRRRCRRRRKRSSTQPRRGEDDGRQSTITGRSEIAARPGAREILRRHGRLVGDRKPEAARRASTIGAAQLLQFCTDRTRRFCEA